MENFGECDSTVHHREAWSDCCWVSQFTPKGSLQVAIGPRYVIQVIKNDSEAKLNAGCDLNRIGLHFYCSSGPSTCHLVILNFSCALWWRQAIGFKFELCCIETNPNFLQISLETCFKWTHLSSSIQLSTAAYERKIKNEWWATCDGTLKPI